MAIQTTESGSLNGAITYKHYCDTFADLENIPQNQITIGSLAVVVNGGDFRVFITPDTHQWVELSTILYGSGELIDNITQLWTRVGQLAQAEDIAWTRLLRTDNRIPIPQENTKQGTYILVMTANGEGKYTYEWRQL